MTTAEETAAGNRTLDHLIQKQASLLTTWPLCFPFGRVIENYIKTKDFVNFAEELNVTGHIGNCDKYFSLNDFRCIILHLAIDYIHV